MALTTTSTGAETTTTSGSSSGGAGGSLPAEWKCLKNFTPPDPKGDVEQSFNLVDAFTMDKITRMEAKVCGTLDSACTSGSPSGVMPDSDGLLTFTEPGGAPKYIDLTDDGTGGAGGGSDAYRHVLAYPAPLIVLPPTPKILRLVTHKGADQLLSLVQQKEEQTKHGIVIVLTQNCDDERAAGVSVTASPTDTTSPDMMGKTVPFYFKNTVPNLTATETDSEGAAGFLNLPAGKDQTGQAITFTATIAKTGQLIGTATATMRPGVITYVHVGPSPS